jgi:hypothetical protein
VNLTIQILSKQKFHSLTLLPSPFPSIRDWKEGQYGALCIELEENINVPMQRKKVAEKEVGT